MNSNLTTQAQSERDEHQEHALELHVAGSRLVWRSTRSRTKRSRIGLGATLALNLLVLSAIIERLM